MLYYAIPGRARLETDQEVVDVPTTQPTDGDLRLGVTSSLASARIPKAQSLMMLLDPPMFFLFGFVMGLHLKTYAIEPEKHDLLWRVQVEPVSRISTSWKAGKHLLACSW